MKRALGSPYRGRLLLALFLCLEALILSGCGGSSSASSIQSSQGQPDFSLSVPPGVTLIANSSAILFVGTKPINGFSSQVNVTVTALPTGVTVVPSEFTVNAGGQQRITVTAALGMGFLNANFTLSASAGPLIHTQAVALTVTAYETTIHPSLRTRFVRTDAAADLGTLSEYPQQGVIYDSTTKRLFVSNARLNHLDVFDASTEMKIAEIPVPGAFVGDESSDHKTIYMGTLIGDLYLIDPVTMAVIKRIPASQIGPNGFSAFEVQMLADGRLVLLGGQAGGIVDGFTDFAVWNPSTNSLSNMRSNNALATCLGGQIGGLALTADRTQILLESVLISTPSGIGVLCEVDPNTLTQRQLLPTGPQVPALPVVLVPPDGKEILVVRAGQVTTYDPSTLAVIDQSEYTGISGYQRYVLSFDGNTLFVVGAAAGLAYDWRNHINKGWFATFLTNDFTWPTPKIVDETGLIVGVAGHGVVFMDGAVAQPSPGTSMGFGQVLKPAFGPTEGGTAVQLNVGIPPSTALQTIYFGNAAASNLIGSRNTITNGIAGVTATTPPNPGGPADVVLTTTDGGLLLLPEAFSYGPSILEVVPNASTAEGSGTGRVYGYGFGPTAPNVPLPADLSVSVGGTPAQVIGYTDLGPATVLYPFPLQMVAFKFPAGVAGSAADVEVSNSSGATAVPGLSYLPSIQQYPLTGAALAQGIYDSTRNLYYFTDTTRVQVFSPSQGWLNPIAMPSGAQRLWGISLSPDANELGVSDAEADRIYVLSTATPGSVRSFNLPNIGADQFQEPCGLAITNAGMVYYASFNSGGTGGTAFHKLNTSTGNVTDFPTVISAAGPGDAYAKVLITTDNRSVYVNFGGGPFLIDTATDTLSFNPSLPAIGVGDYELALASNQARLTASELIIDPQLHPDVAVGLNDRETGLASAVYGQKLSPDGSLLFAPLVNALDIIDGATGRLRKRVALPVNLSMMYDALVSNGRDNILLAITGQKGDGVAVVDLTSASGSLISSTPSSITNAPLQSQLLRSVGATALNTRISSPSAFKGLIAHMQHTTIKVVRTYGAR